MTPNFEWNWGLPPDQWPLGERDVHVWAASGDVSGERICFLQRTLSPDELERAERFHFDRDRNLFIASRGMLREVLGSYWQTSPAQLAFTYNPQGKPSLNSFVPFPLHFNVTHSAGLILIAVTRVCPIGIDVEPARAMNDSEKIAREFFSAREVSELNSLPEEQRAAAFFNLWTRKEACLKATGDGLSERISEMEISFLPGQPAQVRAISGNAQAAAKWTLEELTPAAGFAAAIAAPARDLKLSCWRWPVRAFKEKL